MINTFATGLKPAKNYVLNVINAGDTFTLEQVAIAYEGDITVTPRVIALVGLLTRTGYVTKRNDGKFTRTNK